MEIKVTSLEAKVEQQTLVNEQENQTYSEDDGEKSDNNGDETSQQQHRSCFELKTANPWLTSGMHWIDPDGENSGDPPIHVHCDMETGKND